MNLKRKGDGFRSRTNWLNRFSRPRRTAENPPVRPLEPVKKDTGRTVTRKQVFFVFMTIIVLASACIYHLNVRFQGIALGYEAGRERKIQTQLLLERRELRLEMASLKEQRRIESEARQKLGMEIPSFERIVSVGRQKRTVAASGGAL